MTDITEQEEISAKKLSQDTLDFKKNASRSERRKRLKFYLKEYKYHMKKLDGMTALNEDDSDEKKEALFNFVKRHISHGKILKDYVISFIPKSWDRSKLIFDNKTVYYDGKEI